MKKRIWIFFLVLSISISQVHAQEKIIKMTTCNWPPYSGVNLANLGFTSDLLTRIFEKMGYVTQIEILPWKRAMLKTAKGMYDLVYNAYYSEERAQTYAFTAPYINSNVYLCSKKASHISYVDLKDLIPYKIGVVMGYVNSKAFDKADFLNKEESVTELENLKKLITNRMDLIVADQYVAIHLIKTSPFLISNVTDLTFHEPPLSTMPVYAMFSKLVPGYQERIEAFNLILASLIKDGTYDELLEIHGFK